MKFIDLTGLQTLISAIKQYVNTLNIEQTKDIKAAFPTLSSLGYKTNNIKVALEKGINGSQVAIRVTDGFNNSSSTTVEYVTGASVADSLPFDPDCPAIPSHNLLVSSYKYITDLRSSISKLESVPSELSSTTSRSYDNEKKIGALQNDMNSIYDGSKIKSSVLPSYVDDIIEGTAGTLDSDGLSTSTFTPASGLANEAANAGKLYLDSATGKLFRYVTSSKKYVMISDADARKSANDAAQAASTAQTSAIKAAEAASEAKSAADSALSTANTANTNAGKAQTAANNAQTTANTANNGVHGIQDLLKTQKVSTSEYVAAQGSTKETAAKMTFNYVTLLNAGKSNEALGTETVTILALTSSEILAMFN